MKPALLLLLLCTGCATREVVRIQPVRVIEKHIERYILMVPVPPKLPQLKPKEGEKWA